ncbi:MAG TPA: hypothetical protein VK277_07990 [Acidimicrobiales bacterium]|nr:hypothetical protein [Acidimicrobiales bacterium]
MAKEPSDSPDDAERTAAPSFRERLTATFLRPPDLTKADDKKRPTTDAELKAKINQLDPTERKIGYWGAGLAAFLAIVFTYPYIANPKKGISITAPLSHNHTCPKGYEKKVVSGSVQCVSELFHSRPYWVFNLIVLLLFAGALLLTTRINRRAALGFATLMTGLAFETLLAQFGGYGLLGLPYLFLGGWLIVRAWRAQRYGTTNAKEAAQAAAEQRAEKKAARQGGSTTSATRSAKTTKSTAKGSTKGSTTGSSRPTPVASKRYTPKSPPKKKTTRST